MNTFHQHLTSGPPRIGMAVSYPSPGVVERIGPDWDFIWIDGQHGELSDNDILALVRACDLVKTPALVRVPWLEAGAIGRALDTGAAGVIVPCIDSRKEALAAVAAAKFPPLGRRSYGARRLIDFHGRGYADTANEDQLLIVQIESPTAVAAVEDIAAVDGVDALMIGPDDLLMHRGFPAAAPRSPETLVPDIRAIGEAAARHGKPAVGVGGSAAMLQLYRAYGYHLIVIGSDVTFLAPASRAAAAEARAELLSETPEPVTAVSLGTY